MVFVGSLFISMADIWELRTPPALKSPSQLQLLFNFFYQRTKIILFSQGAFKIHLAQKSKGEQDLQFEETCFFFGIRFSVPKCLPALWTLRLQPQIIILSSSCIMVRTRSSCCDALLVPNIMFSFMPKNSNSICARSIFWKPWDWCQYLFLRVWDREIF